MNPKTLIVTRHAHREVRDPYDDNGLSAKGQKQAEALKEHFKKTFKGTSPLLLSSPRVRCQETLAPLSESLQIPVQISTLLDEGSQEAGGRLHDRVLKLKNWWLKEAPPFCIICSHGDWLPLFFEAAIEQSLDLKKAGWAELEAKDGQVKLKNLIQSWPL